ncbi:MAG: hypothetical protein GY853_09720 [PVC group bacterium]|nr:hypothetical protein [PVC group bacterium]
MNKLLCLCLLVLSLFVSCMDYENVDITIIDEEGNKYIAKNANVYINESVNYFFDEVQVCTYIGESKKEFKIRKLNIKTMIIKNMNRIKK